MNMNKRLLLITILLTGFSVIKSAAQQTYYWVGGANATWTLASNWNTSLAGTGTSRNTPATNDILIFDGSNISGASPSTGQVTVTNVSNQTIGSLIFQNAANVRFITSPGVAGAGTTAAGVLIGTSPNATGQTITGTGTSFTTFFTVGDFISYATANTGTGSQNSLGQITSITNDNTLVLANGIVAMTATTGSGSFYIKSCMVRISSALNVDATSRFEMASSAPLIFKLNAGAIGSVYGTVNLSSNFQKIVVDQASTTSLTFYSGSIFQFSGSQSTAPFDALANATNNNVIFKSGATFDNSSTASANTNANGNIFGAVIPASVLQFEKGSIFLQNSNTLSSVVSSSQRAYPKVILNGTTSAWQPTTIVDTLIVGPNTTWTTNSNSFFPIKGDFIINGTFTASTTSSPVFIFCGNGVQNVVNNGTITNTGLARVIVAPNATLKLGSNILQTTQTALGTNGAYVRNFGTVDFGTFTFNNAVTAQAGALQGYPPANTTTGTQTGATVSAATPYAITVTSNTGFAQGMVLTGTGIPANTIILLSSSALLTVSNPIPPGTYDITSSVNPNGSTFITNNAGGISANYPLAGTSSYAFGASGSNFIFNAATTTPFASGLTSLSVNNLTLAANVTNNVTALQVNGTLNLAANFLTVNAGDTLKLNTQNAVAGSSNTRYIRLSANTTTGSLGYVRLLNTSALYNLPIGNAAHYLPVSVTPVAAGEDYYISTFSGVTQDGTVNGTPFSAAQKQNVVDAVWVVNNNFTPTGNSTVQVGWPAALEGSGFSTLLNNNIGLSLYSAGSWGNAAGSGNNTANTATNSINAFGPLGVGAVGFSLPVKFGTVQAIQLNNQQYKISWQVINEVNTAFYSVEFSNDGRTFVQKGIVNALGLSQYSFTDVASIASNGFYRIKATDKNGAITYSTIVKVSNTKSGFTVSIYPNPAIGKTVYLSVDAAEAKKFTINVVDLSGRNLITKVVQHIAGSSVYTVELPATLVGGNYLVNIFDHQTQKVSSSKITVQ